MKYIYELTWTNKIKKHKVLKHIKIGKIDIVNTELLGVILFKQTIVKNNNSHLFKGYTCLKNFVNKELDNNIDFLKVKINLLKEELKVLNKNLINSEKRKKETEMFIENEIKLIKKQYEKDI